MNKMILILLLLCPLSSIALDERHCALIDASMASGQRELSNGEWSSFQQTRLGVTLNAVGNPAGVFIHSHAIGGAGPVDLWRQWEEIQMRWHHPDSMPLHCVIVGLSGAVVGDLYGTMDSLLALMTAIKATGLRVIGIGFPPVDRLGAHWLENVGAPGLAKQGYTLSDYEAARGWYADRVRTTADAYVNPWRVLVPIEDGLHPTWTSSYIAAITVIDAVVYDRVYLP